MTYSEKILRIKLIDLDRDIAQSKLNLNSIWTTNKEYHQEEIEKYKKQQDDIISGIAAIQVREEIHA